MAVSNGTQAVNGYGSSFAAKHELPSHFIGGNRLDLARPGAVKDFVANHQGHSVITSVCDLRFFFFLKIRLKLSKGERTDIVWEDLRFEDQIKANTNNYLHS